MTLDELERKLEASLVSNKLQVEIIKEFKLLHQDLKGLYSMLEDNTNFIRDIK